MTPTGASAPVWDARGKPELFFMSDRVDWSLAYRLFPGNVAYVWHAGVHGAEVAAGLEGVGFCIRAQIIWVKQHFALSRGDFHWRHEPCWYAVRRGKSSHWCG